AGSGNLLPSGEKFAWRTERLCGPAASGLGQGGKLGLETGATLGDRAAGGFVRRRGAERNREERVHPLLGPGASGPRAKLDAERGVERASGERERDLAAPFACPL